MPQRMLQNPPKVAQAPLATSAYAANKVSRIGLDPILDT